MNFFCSVEHLNTWLGGAQPPAGRALTLREAARLGRRIWNDVVKVSSPAATG